MAQRRMFNKSITNSSLFLKMPATSRLLYYDLGMNADDDGFVEHFMVLRMTGATQQDLGVLELNGLVKIFDENVLWIKDWKENNYIRNDRYEPSKYLSVYNLDTIGIPAVSTGKDSIGKDSIDNNIYSLEEPKENKTIKLIIDYLNSKAMTNYRATSQTTKKHINARLKEGYKFDDFVTVIDNKTREWMKTDMEKYLRPETLFGSKFESYLNQKDSSRPVWFDKKQETSKITKEEETKMNAMMEKYK